MSALQRAPDAPEAKHPHIMLLPSLCITAYSLTVSCFKSVFHTPLNVTTAMTARQFNQPGRLFNKRTISWLFMWLFELWLLPLRVAFQSQVVRVHLWEADSVFPLDVTMTGSSHDEIKPKDEPEDTHFLDILISFAFSEMPHKEVMFFKGFPKILPQVGLQYIQMFWSLQSHDIISQAFLNCIKVPYSRFIQTSDIPLSAQRLHSSYKALWLVTWARSAAYLAAILSGPETPLCKEVFSSQMWGHVCKSWNHRNRTGSKCSSGPSLSPDLLPVCGGKAKKPQTGHE